MCEIIHRPPRKLYSPPRTACPGRLQPSTDQAKTHEGFQGPEGPCLAGAAATLLGPYTSPQSCGQPSRQRSAVGGQAFSTSACMACGSHSQYSASRSVGRGDGVRRFWALPPTPGRASPPLAALATPSCPLLTPWPGAPALVKLTSGTSPPSSQHGVSVVSFLGNQGSKETLCPGLQPVNRT